MTIACQSFERYFINAKEMHPFPLTVEMQLSFVHTIAIVSNSESSRFLQNQIHLLLSESKLLA